jgi:hypothetical protein
MTRRRKSAADAEMNDASLNSRILLLPLPLRETTAWTQEVEQRMEQLPRVGVRGQGVRCHLEVPCA